MRAVTISEPGGPEVLGWDEVPDPVCGPGEVLVDVAATAVNRADLLQRQGHYPPPPGASEILGLECSGVVSEVGAGVTPTAGSAEKLAFCRELGAEIGIDYRDQDFVEAVRTATDGHGADVVL